MTSDSVNLGSNPSPPATGNADVSDVSDAKPVSEQPEYQEHSRTIRRTNPGTARRQVAPVPSVYFIYCAGFVKIGFATDVLVRLGGITVDTPHTPTVLWTTPGDRKLEREFHARFATSRWGGEWFEFSPELRQFLTEKLAPTVGGVGRMNRVEEEFRAWMRCAIAEVDDVSIRMRQEG